eukprot:SAG31_NODE_10278_length_1161_cov_1.645009_1_plen_100_part_10
MLLRTHPPEPGLPGVASMAYAGAFPVSRIKIKSPHLEGSQVTLYGLSGFRLHDANASNMPAIWFAVDIKEEMKQGDGEEKHDPADVDDYGADGVAAVMLN